MKSSLIKSGGKATQRAVDKDEWVPAYKFLGFVCNWREMSGRILVIAIQELIWVTQKKPYDLRLHH